MARTAAFGLAGLLLAMAGLGCLTVAAWIVIATHHGAVIAWAIIGGVCLVLGALFMAVATRSPRNARRDARRGPYDDPRSPREPLVQIAEGFVIGMQAGRAMRRPRR